MRFLILALTLASTLGAQVRFDEIYKWCPGPGVEPAQYFYRGILSLG